MHIEKRTVQQLAGLSLDDLCALDTDYKHEIDRLTTDRAALRSVLHASAREAGHKGAPAAIEAYKTRMRKLKAVPQVEVKGVPDVEVKA